MTTSNQKNITGIILAGGKSSRMGRDKGLIVHDGKTFVERIIDAMRPLVDEIILVANNSEYDRFKVRRVPDLIPDAGPLAGVYTGLHFSETEKNLALSCDVPLITTGILEQLILASDEDHDIIQLESQGNTLPLIALYKKHCENTFQKLLEEGERRLQTAVTHCHVKTISLDDNDARYVINVNTPDQLKGL